MEKYEIIEDKELNKLNITLRGRFSCVDYEQYIREYIRKSNYIEDKSNYTLEFNCDELEVTATDAIDSLEHSFSLYKGAGFSNIEFITSNNRHNSILNLQFNRLARKVGMKITIS